MRLLLCCALAAVAIVACAAAAAAQDADPPRFDEQVEVVGVTPIHGAGLPRTRIPANVQVFSIEQLRSAAPSDVPAMLAGRAASLHVNDVQAGTFQPDLLFRGFSASPLLGASAGLAVYQDGVRVNDPFGDAINWDALPAVAVASVNLLPGSNPLFGLNALGGALSLQTKTGFDVAGHRVSASGGSYGRATVEAETGGRRGAFAYYAAGTFAREAGWRDHSRSTVRRLFTDITWRGTSASFDVSLTAAGNDLSGNGSAPPELLDADRSAVFTYPDLTSHDLALVTVRGTRTLSPSWVLEGLGYVRRAAIDTFNGDLGDEDAAFNALNNRSRSRGLGGGATVQATRARPLAGRDNMLIAGGGIDAAGTDFMFGSELATLTADRGTIGSGIFDDEQEVGLDSRAITASAFITNTWSASPAVALTGSARVNRSAVRLRDRLGTALNGDHRFIRLNPAGGITVDLGQRVNVFLGYAESSRVPTPVELTCADEDDPCRLPNAFVSDPPLDQVVARTLELGIRQRGMASWSVAAFLTRASDDIIFVSSGSLRGEGHFTNVPRTNRSGVEAGVEWAWRRLSAFGNYTLQRAIFGTPLTIASPNHPLAVGAEIRVAAGSRLPGVPAHSGKLGVTAAPWPRLNVTALSRLQSGHYLRGDEANLLDHNPGFAIVHLSARLRLHERLTLTGQVDNLFDARYSTFGILGDASFLDIDDPRFVSPGAPRGGWIGLDVAF